MVPLILLAALLCTPGVLLLIARQMERYRIRQSGTRMIARIVQVRSWQDPPATRGIFPQMSRAPLSWGQEWRYEIIAECTDTITNETYTLSSGPRKGLPRYQRGEYLPAYISPKGNYLEIS